MSACSCPLARCKLFGKTALAGLADATGRSEAQLAIRYLVQHGFVCVPKSVTPERLRQNCAVFDFALSADQMAAIDGLDQGFEASNAVRAMQQPWAEIA